MIAMQNKGKLSQLNKKRLRQEKRIRDDRMRCRMQSFKIKDPKPRLAIAFIGVALVLALLTVFIFNMGRQNRSAMTINLLNQARYKSLELPARRGDILDANGVVLATSTKAYDIALDIQYLRNDDDVNYTEEQRQSSIKATVEALAESFGMDETAIYQAVSEKQNARYHVLKKGASQSEKDSFESKYILSEIEVSKLYSDNDEKTADKLVRELKNEKAEMKKLIRGVVIETRYVRSYPYKSLASHVIGFCDASGAGQAGIEKYYDSYLTGKNGKLYSYMDAGMMPVTKEKTPEDGGYIRLTLDVRHQSVVEKHIKKFKAAHETGNGKFGAKNIAVVVMDPRNGAIKAMASNLGYDLNEPRNLAATKLYTKEELASMTDAQISSELNALWKNYCISDAYEPGSTFKPILLSYALDNGAVKYHTGFECNGKLHVGDRDISCSSKIGHGKETVEQALVNSCNVAFMQIGFNVKKEGLEACQNLFNFGLKTNIDLPDEVYTYNSIHRAESMGIMDLATNSFGQNFEVSMIQMATAFSSVINGGTYYRPRAVSEFINTYNNTTVENKPVVLRKTVSGETSAGLKRYLHTTVKSRQTEEELSIAGAAEIGGKTGTAEKLPRDKTRYLISFIGFTPIDEPRLVCYVVLDEPNLEKQDNSAVAMELGKSIIRELNQIR